MEVLKDYPKEFAKLFRPSFNYLSKINMKFVGKEGCVRKYWRYLYIIPCLVMNYVTLGWNLANMAAGGEIFEIAYLVPLFLVCTQANLKAIVLIAKSSLLTSIIEELGSLWRTTGLNESQKNARDTLLKGVNFCIGLRTRRGMLYEEVLLRADPFFISLLELYCVSIFGASQYFTTPLEATDGGLRELCEQSPSLTFANRTRVRNCYLMTYWLSIIGTTQYLSTPLVETVVRRYLLDQECELLLPLECTYPFQHDASWAIYLPVYGFQVYCIFLCVSGYIGAELIMITVCALLGVEFTLLCEDMLHVKPKQGALVNQSIGGDNEGESVWTLKDIVQRHQKLCALSKQLDEAFNQMIFINLLFVGLTTCFFRYAAQFSRGPTYMINNYVGVIASLLYVLYLCYYGEIITEGSLRIGDMAYRSSWLEGDHRYKKAIMIIIMRSQKPCGLTSMNYAPVSLNMFSKVVSSTCSYITLMNHVYEQN